MNTRLLAVVMPPPRLAVPVWIPFFSSSSKTPSGTRHTMSPVFALTAISSPDGARKHHDVLVKRRGSVRDRVLQLVLVPQARAVRGELGRNRRGELSLLQRDTRERRRLERKRLRRRRFLAGHGALRHGPLFHP